MTEETPNVSYKNSEERTKNIMEKRKAIKKLVLTTVKDQQNIDTQSTKEGKSLFSTFCTESINYIS